MGGSGARSAFFSLMCHSALCGLTTRVKVQGFKHKHASVASVTRRLGRCNVLESDVCTTPTHTFA